MKKEEIKKSLNHLISSLIIIGILIILLLISSFLPGSKNILFILFNFEISTSTLITLIIVVSIIYLLFMIIEPAKLLLTNFLSKSNSNIYNYVEPLSINIIYLILVSLIYTIGLIFTKKIVDVMSSLNWLYAIFTISLIIIIIVFLFLLYKNIQIYLDAKRLILLDKSENIKSNITEKTKATKNTKICPNCGAKNPPESKFCINCGTSLEENK